MRLGTTGEELAVNFLKKRGYTILERNYRNAFGEIDIVARHRGTLVFVEVKTRMTDDYGKPFEAVDSRKQKKMKTTALMYLKRFRKEVPARFDVVSILLNEESPGIDLIQDAFAF